MQISPTSDEYIEIIKEEFYTNRKPVDAAMVMADLCVLDALRKKEAFTDDTISRMVKSYENKENLSDEEIKNLLLSMVENDLKYTQKL